MAKKNKQNINPNGFNVPQTLVRYRGANEDDHITILGDMDVSQHILFNELQKSGKSVAEIIGKCQKHVVFIKHDTDQYAEMVPNLFHELPTEEKDTVLQAWAHWNLEDKRIICFHLDDDFFITAFALIHKTDFDPYKRHKRPHVIDFIYTLPNHRRQGHAELMLYYIKRHYETTAFVITTEGKSLFKKCDFQTVYVTINRLLMPSYRFP